MLFHSLVADVVVFVIVVVESVLGLLLCFFTLVGDRVDSMMVVLWAWNLIHDILVHKVRLITEAYSDLVDFIVELLSLLVKALVQMSVLMWNLDVQLFEVLWDAESLVLRLGKLQILERLVGFRRVESGWRR